MGKRTRIVIDEAASLRGRGGNVTVTADPLVIDFNEDELERGPAKAIATAIGEGIARIGEAAAPATVARRRRAGIADTRKFNATGALAHGITIVPTSDGVEIVGPAGRLVGDQLEQLAALVPELDDPTTDAGVERALDEADAALLGSVTKKVR